MKTIHGVLVDPFNRTCTDVDIPAHGSEADRHQWNRMKELIAAKYLQCVHLGEHLGIEQDLWLDEEGLINKPWQEQAFFVLRSPEDRPGVYANHPLAGRALLLGGDNNDGNIVGTVVKAGKFERMVAWVDREVVVVPRPTFQSLDESLRPIGPREVLAPDRDGETTWDINNQPR